MDALRDELGLTSDEVIPWGRHRAKIARESLDPRGSLVLVSAINPTPAGEGKTTMSVALAMGLRRRNKRVIVALRQPSLGPVFGLKGGGTGGGRATLEPSRDINLNRNSDLHPVADAHNLLAALIENALHFGAPVTLDPLSVRWRRVLDVNDRALRSIVVGLGGRANGAPRETGFDITAASEVMAVLCLARSRADLIERLARIVVGRAPDGTPRTAADLNAHGAMAALLDDARLPNLVQTAEGGPALIHGGPFANIAHGCSSLAATRLGLDRADLVVTEAGFGFDLGGEKFLNIKCRAGGIWPRAVVLVATLRALRYHGGVDAAAAARADRSAVVRGLELVGHHLQAVRSFGIEPVIVLNRFEDDPADEVNELRDYVRSAGATMAECDAFARGSEGALDFADVVADTVARAEKTAAAPRYTYSLEQPLKEKIGAVVRTVHGGRAVAFSLRAERELAELERAGGAGLPVCMAKTHLSLTDDPTVRGRPKDFVTTVREVRWSAGAGFVVALTGELVTMPGLPKQPASSRIALDSDGTIRGL